MRTARIASITALVVTIITLCAAGAANATTVPGCAGPTTSGDWPWYSGALAQPGNPGGDRIQTAEQKITPANASTLGLAWKLKMPDGGQVNGTPTESDGCVFVGTDLGNIYAINADTGQLVWQNAATKDSGGTGFTGAGVVGSPAVYSGMVYAGVTTPSSIIEVALSEATGQLVWTDTLNTDPGATADSSSVPFAPTGLPLGSPGSDGMVFQSYSADESSDHANPGYDIMDASTGTILYAGKVIPPADYAAPLAERGGSITDTPAVDVGSMTLYAGTGNPASANVNPYTDAELKIDVNPVSATFGRILGYADGDTDSFPAPTNVSNPACDRNGYNGLPALQWPLGAFECAQFDYDFLSSPVLVNRTDGKQEMVEFQKSGLVQAVDTSNMKVLWQTRAGGGCFGCDLSDAAADGNSIYIAYTGGNLFALNKDTGAIEWADPLNGTYHFNGLSVANGVVYNLDDAGFLQAYNAATGQLLLAKSLASDNGSPTADGENSSGLAMARDTVYFTSQAQPSGGSTLFAYKLGGGSGLPPVPNLPPLPGPPGVPTPAQSVITGPAATNTGFATQDVVIRQGESLNYTNLDTVEHNVTSATAGLFSSSTVGVGNTVPVNGVSQLAPGTYQFFCSIHPWMTGQIIVEAIPAPAGAN